MLSEEVQGWLERPALFATPPDMSVIRSARVDPPVLFVRTDAADRIQKKQGRGKFYEPDELAVMAAHLRHGGTFCDVGANIGNHTLFALTQGGAARAVVFEPNPAAYRILVAVLILNGLLERVDHRWLGLGLGARAGEGFGLVSRERNLGATRMVPETGGLQVIDGDTCLGETGVAFLKVDVEGMEMEVLAGLARTIARDRPPILLEADRANDSRLADWMGREGYRIEAEVRAFRDNRNLLLLPEA